MAVSDQQLLPFAILASLIFEDKDNDLIEIARQYISKNAVHSDSKQFLHPNKYSVTLKLKEPFKIPRLKEGKIEGKDLQVRLKLDDFHVVDIGEFTAKKLKKCCLNLDFEYIKLVGAYTIDGTIYDTEFNGGGSAEIILRNVSSEARIDHTLLDDNITDGRIKQLNLDFDFKVLEFEQNGLTIRNMPNSEVKRILNSVGKVYFKQNLKAVSRKLSNTIKDRLNAILKDKNKVQITELLQQGNIKL